MITIGVWSLPMTLERRQADPRPAFTPKEGFTAAHPTWNLWLFKTVS